MSSFPEHRLVKSQMFSEGLLWCWPLDFFLKYMYRRSILFGGNGPECFPFLPAQQRIYATPPTTSK